MISRIENLVAAVMQERYPTEPELRENNELPEVVVTLKGRPVGKRRVTFEATRPLHGHQYTIYEVGTREDKTVDDNGLVVVTHRTPYRVPIIRDADFPDFMKALIATEKKARTIHRHALKP